MNLAALVLRPQQNFAVLRPRRSLVLPFLVVAVPALYFVYRDASVACATGRSCPDAADAGYAFAGILGAYLLAAGVLAVAEALAGADVPALADRHPYARLALRPTDATLGVLGVFVTVTGAYLLASLVTTIPAWLDALLAPFGLVLALPFAASYAAMVVVTSALFSEPSIPFQSAVVAVSLALTAVWLFALAAGTASLLASRGVVGADPR